MDNVVVKCSCGVTTFVDLSEGYNKKDTFNCDCGKKYLIVDISE